MRFLDIAIILRILLEFFQVFYAIFLGFYWFSKILGFFHRFFEIFDEVYEDFQSNLPLEMIKGTNAVIQSFSQTFFTNSSKL
jgi:hypothetical protein